MRPTHALAIAILLAPSLAAAHGAGMLDRDGCHADRRAGGYHCHRGEYDGITFTSKADLREKKEAGMTAAAIRAERGELPAAGDDGQGLPGDATGLPPVTSVTPREESGWRSWVPFIGDSGTETRAAHNDVIVPRGIEQRLRVLKDLHTKELITDEEYAAKRKEILGEL